MEQGLYDGNIEMDEATYPESFNMDEFSNLRTFAERVRYCNQRLQKLGSGTARIVYAVDTDTVLKLAKNAKGVAQNQAEAGDWYLKSMGLFAKVYDYPDNFQWIEMQRCIPAKKSDFKRITGESFETYCSFIRYMQERYMRRTYFPVEQGLKEYFDRIIESDGFEDTLFYDIYSYMGDYQPQAVGDMMRISSWGIVRDDDGSARLVMVDFGLNDDVYDEFYKR